MKNLFSIERPLKKNPKTAVFCVALLLLNSMIFCRSLFLGGVWPVTHEMLHPLVRLFEFDYALKGGQFPVRWCDNLSAGFGYPFFSFYPPLSFLLANVFHFLGLNLALSWKIEILLMRWLGAIGVFALLKSRTRNFGATVAAILYIFAPYHIMTVYVRGNIPEFTALSVMPFAFWGVHHCIGRTRDWRSPAIPLTAIAIAALFLSHVLTSYMAAFNLMLWALFCSGAFSFNHKIYLSKPFQKKILIIISIALFSAALSAFFIFPALMELPFCRPRILTDYIKIQDHFVYPWQLIYPGWGWGLSLPGESDGISFQIGLVFWIMIAFAISKWIFGKARRNRGLARFSLFMFFLHLFLMTRFSKSLWDIIPGASFMQFPWRLLIPATFWASLSAGLAAEDISRALKSKEPLFRYAFTAILILAPPALVWTYMRPLYFFYEIPDYEAPILRKVMTNTTADEYLPKWVEKKPERASSWNIVLPRGGTATLEERHSGFHRFTIDALEPQFAVFDVFWFPGWEVLVDGAIVESGPLYPLGLIQWQNPKGKSTVVIRFGSTPLRRSADLVSLISLILATAWLARYGVCSILSSLSRTGPRNC